MPETNISRCTVTLGYKITRDPRTSPVNHTLEIHILGAALLVITYDPVIYTYTQIWFS